MKTITLKNGADEIEPLVVATMLSLENLFQTNLVATYELVEICKNSTHKLFGNTGDILKDMSLVESNGQVHNFIKNIVLSAFERSN